MRIILTCAALLLAFPAGGGSEEAEEASIVKKLTPVLFVDEIEPALPFWEEQLGFARTAEVPHGGRLGFVMLAKDGVEVMYQTQASMADDIPAVAKAQPTGGAFLYIEVEDLDAVDAALREYERVIPRRKTFYGADEIVVREPGGNVVAFAQFGGG